MQRQTSAPNAHETRPFRHGHRRTIAICTGAPVLDDFLAELIEDHWKEAALDIEKPASDKRHPDFSPSAFAIVDLDLVDRRGGGFAAKLMDHAAAGHPVIVIARNGGKMVHDLHKAGCIVADKPSVGSFLSILDAVAAGTYAEAPAPFADGTSERKGIFTEGAFTRRETEVLSWIARGFKNRQIAAELGIKEATVRTYIESIFGKTGIHSKHRLVIEMSRQAAFAVSPAEGV